MKKPYDFIILGAGLSGTTLLCYLLHSSFSKKKILLIDKKFRRPYRRDWSFWINKPHVFEQLVKNRWDSFSVFFNDHERTFQLTDYSVHLLRSADLFEYRNALVDYSPSVRVVEEEVLSYTDVDDLVTVQTTGGEYRGSYLFDSCQLKSEQIVEDSNDLKMEGFGWEVRSSLSCFNADDMTLFDFRFNPEHELGFFYLLPLSPKKALIQYGSFTTVKRQKTEDEYRSLLMNYLTKRFPGHQFFIKEDGFNSIPLNQKTLERKVGERTLLIGVKGGRMKSSTSYALTRILKDSELIVESLEKTGKPFYVEKHSFFREKSSEHIIHLMKENPALVRKMFERMFLAASSGDTIFSFLDDTASFFDTVQLVSHAALTGFG